MTSLSHPYFITISSIVYPYDITLLSIAHHYLINISSLYHQYLPSIICSIFAIRGYQLLVLLFCYTINEGLLGTGLSIFTWSIVVALSL